MTPPLGLLEFLERSGSAAKAYEIQADTEQLSLALGCQEDDILTASLVCLLYTSPSPRDS